MFVSSDGLWLSCVVWLVIQHRNDSVVDVIHVGISNGAINIGIDMIVSGRMEYVNRRLLYSKIMVLHVLHYVHKKFVMMSHRNYNQFSSNPPPPWVSNKLWIDKLS